MKAKLFTTTLLLSIFLFVTQSVSYSQTKHKDNKQALKLTVDDKLKVLSSEIKLTEKEKNQIKTILTNYQNSKKRIKGMNVPKKENERHIDKLKDIQKNNLKQI